jgi:hypothetical protein
MKPPSYKYYIDYYIRALIADENNSGDYCEPIPITFKLQNNWKISTVDGFESIETQI